jgi:hypothetical protein
VENYAGRDLEITSQKQQQKSSYVFGRQKTVLTGVRLLGKMADLRQWVRVSADRWAQDQLVSKGQKPDQQQHSGKYFFWVISSGWDPKFDVRFCLL